LIRITILKVEIDVPTARRYCT